MMQSKWRPTGAASSALLLALCMQQCVSFQIHSQLARSSVQLQPLAPSTPRPIRGRLFASETDGDADTTKAKAEEDCDCSDTPIKDDGGPDILKPYLPALDPNYSTNGPIGQGKFIISRTGGPTAEELTNEQMLKIIKIETTDLEVNTLVWKCLGYRFDEENSKWNPDEVFPKWKVQYPDPPDFVGMKRVYEKEVDQPSLRANQALVKSVPKDNKQSLKESLKPLGWKGFQYKELTPNKTRRAQCANWLVFYREELFGYTVEELKEKRKLKNEKEAAAAAEEAANKSDDDDEGEKKKEWKLPVREVF